MARVMCIYGNPKQGGFVHGCVDHIAARLEEKGVETDQLRLLEAEIRDCRGCFNCLRTGKCAIEDDMGQIMERIRRADGLVTGASVRNGFFPALFKRFYERLSYIMGFGRELHGKYILAVGAVGFAGGRRQLKKVLTFDQFHTYVSGYLFFRTGIPSQLKVDDVAPRLDVAVDRFHLTISRRPRLSMGARILVCIDDFVVRRFMLKPNPDHVYDYIIARWKEKGLM